MRTLTLLCCLAVIPWLHAAPVAEYTPNAVIVADVPLIHTAQLLPQNATGRQLVGTNDPARQTEQVLHNIGHGLKKVCSHPEVVKLNVYVASNEIVPLVQAAVARSFPTNQPAISFVVTALPDSQAVVAMDAIAAAPTTTPTEVQRFQAAMLPPSKFSAHSALLPAGGVIYLAGQAKTGTNLAEATRGTLEKLSATLDFLGLKKKDVVQAKAFFHPMSEVTTVQKELAEFFAPDLAPPAVFVEDIATTKDLPIEIELITAPGGNATNATTVTYLNPPSFKPSPLFNRVAIVNRGRKIYFSSLYSAAGAMDGENKSIFDSLRELAQNSGSDLQHLVKATYYVSTDKASAELNQVRPKYFDGKHAPTASKMKVKGVGREGKSATVDMIAVTAH